MSYLTEDDVARLLALPSPDTAAMVDLDDATRKAIEDRVSALTALNEGEPVKRVATLYGIHRKTCERMLELANKPAPSGGVVRLARSPWKPPSGVRATETMTTGSDMQFSC